MAASSHVFATHQGDKVWIVVQGSPGKELDFVAKSDLTLKNVFDSDSKGLSDQKGKLERRVVFALFQCDHGLASDSYSIRQCLLR